MAKKNKIPEIRFKRFSGEWNSQTIDKLIKDGILLPPKDGNHGSIHPKSTDYIDYGIPFIMANNIKNGEIDFCNCSHISKEQANTLQKGFAKEGDVLLTHKGTVGEVAVIPKNKFPYLMLTPQVTYYRIIKNEQLYNNFLAFSFIVDSFQHTLKETSGGGTRAYIGITEQQKLEISIPPKAAEQFKIGNYFQQLDTLITHHQRKLDKILNIKKALLEKIFPKKGANIPEIHFKNFSEKWKKKRLGAVASFSKGHGYSKKDLIEVGNPIILYGRLYTKYQTTISEVDTFVLDNNNSIYSKGNEVIVPASGETAEDIARASAVVKSGIILGGDLNIIYPNNKVNSIFLALTISNGEPQKYLSKRAQGKSVVHLRNDDLKEVEIYYPSKKEQTKICKLFKNIDTLLNIHQSQLEKLKNIKKSCLEKMFV